MKTFLVSLCAFGFASVCAGAPDASSQTNQKTINKMLIVYYSWSGNTRTLAQRIQQLTGADMFEIKPATPYPSDFDACAQQAEREIKGNVRPDVMQMPANIADYDVVFVGSPNWWGTIAPPIATFLTKADLQGKVIVPFCTHGTGGVQNLFPDMAKLAAQSKFVKGLGVEGKNIDSSQSDIESWVKNLNTK